MPKYTKEEPEEYRVAALDIESLSLRQSAALTEVGYVVATLPHISKMPLYRDYITIQKTLRFDLLEQLKLGRHVDPISIQMHENLFGEAGYRDSLYEQPTEDNNVHFAMDALLTMVEDLRNVDEIWINHTSFDQGRLKNLAEQLGLFTDLWHYRAEKDIATLGTTLLLAPQDPTAPKAVHRGLDDAFWNMDKYAQFALHFKPEWVPERGYRWTPTEVQAIIDKGIRDLLSELKFEIDNNGVNKLFLSKNLGALIAHHDAQNPAPTVEGFREAEKMKQDDINDAGNRVPREKEVCGRVPEGDILPIEMCQRNRQKPEPRVVTGNVTIPGYTSDVDEEVNRLMSKLMGLNRTIAFGKATPAEKGQFTKARNRIKKLTGSYPDLPNRLTNSNQKISPMGGDKPSLREQRLALEEEAKRRKQKVVKAKK